MLISRRTFLHRTGVAVVLASTGASLPSGLSAGQAFNRPGQPRFGLSLAAYSFRKHFAWMKGKTQRPDNPAMDLFQFIDYCADHGCQGAELTSYFIPPDAGLTYYNNLKRHAFLRGVTISGTAIGNDFSLAKGPELNAQIEAAKRGLDQAAALGAPHVRFFAGRGEGFKQGPERIENAKNALQTCADYAAKKGIFIGVENHGDLTPQLLLELIHKVDSPWIGINLDTGNFFSDTPYDDLKLCAPFAVNVQVKVNMQTPKRKQYPADLNRISDILRKANYQGFVVLEFEEEDPFAEVPEWLVKLDSALKG